MIKCKLLLYCLVMLFCSSVLARTEYAYGDKPVIDFFVGKPISDFPVKRKHLTSIETEARWLFIQDSTISHPPIINPQYNNEGEVLQYLKNCFSNIKNWDNVKVYYIEFDKIISIPDFFQLKELISLIAIKDGIILDLCVQSYSLDGERK